MSDLFQAAGLTPEAPRPLADRLRPKTLDEVTGQDHLLQHLAHQDILLGSRAALLLQLLLHDRDAALQLVSRDGFLIDHRDDTVDRLRRGALCHRGRGERRQRRGQQGCHGGQDSVDWWGHHS